MGADCSRGMGVSFPGVEKVLALDSGNGFATLWRY